MFMYYVSYTHIHTYTMEYYSTLKKEILSHSITWTKFGIMLSEISHRKTNPAWFYLYKVSKIIKFIELESKMMVAKDQWREVGRCSMAIEFSVMQILEICCITMCILLIIYTVYLKFC